MATVENLNEIRVRNPCHGQVGSNPRAGVSTWKIDTKQKTQAAEMLADGGYTEYDICQKIGIKPATLESWRKKPAMQEKIASIVSTFDARIYGQHLCRRSKRLEALSFRHQKLQSLMAARAECPSMDGIAGGNTGLIEMTDKGPKVDYGILKEMREIEKQAAMEMGQWCENHSVEVKETVIVRLGAGCSVEDL